MKKTDITSMKKAGMIFLGIALIVFGLLVTGSLAAFGLVFVGGFCVGYGLRMR